jgi:hypothetical protein
MPMPRSVYRNELFVRVGDATLDWLDARRGEETRSAYVRRILERESNRDLLKESAGEQN